jgi:hypothetical protein
MIKLLFVGIVVIIFFSAFLIIIRNKPDLWFWIFLNLYFDPGGYVYGFMGGTLFGPLHIQDVLISGIIICMISAHINWRSVFQDTFLKKYLFFLLLFTLYFYIAYGAAVPIMHNDFNYPEFLMKNRLFIYGYIILFAVYAFSLRGLYYFYTTTLSVGVICLTLFFITLTTGIGLIPVWEFARNPGDEMMRVSMLGYGIFYLVFPVSVIVYLLSKKINLNIKHRNWLYYGGIVMIITLLITLTRRIQIDVIGSVIIISFIISYLFKTGKLSTILKIVLPALLVVLVMYFTFPKYVGYMAEIAEDTFLLITTGMDSKGETDQRVTGTDDYVLVKEYIEDNIFWGSGYTYLSWGPGYASSARGDSFSQIADAAGEVPIYNLIFSFGIIGAALMLPLYFIMGELFFKLIKLLRVTFIDLLQDPLTIVLSIHILLTIAKKFTINLYALSQDYVTHHMGHTALLIGLGVALYRKLNLNLLKKYSQV